MIVIIGIIVAALFFIAGRQLPGGGKVRVSKLALTDAIENGVFKKVHQIQLSKETGIKINKIVGQRTKRNGKK